LFSQRRHTKLLRQKLFYSVNITFLRHRNAWKSPHVGYKGAEMKNALVKSVRRSFYNKSGIATVATAAAAAGVDAAAAATHDGGLGLAMNTVPVRVVPDAQASQPVWALFGLNVARGRGSA
jgi:hypothetical protein